MKKRLGFVSNSSASSFVVFGFPFDDTKYNEGEFQEYMFLYPKTADVNETIIGIEISNFSPGAAEGSGYEMSLLETVKSTEELARKFNLKLDDVKIYRGTQRENSL